MWRLRRLPCGPYKFSRNLCLPAANPVSCSSSELSFLQLYSAPRLPELRSWSASNPRSTAAVVSGIQPTGVPHLGNYLGAISHWVALQDTCRNTFYSVVNLHAITMPQDPETLRTSTRKLAACLIACGIDPNKSSLFIQSHVPMHSELCWILGCSTPYYQLGRMPQYKDKKGTKPHLGLFSYPVLMAADILLYKATHVPVGDDQVQHLELANNIARSFNVRYGEFFPLPMAISDPKANTKRLMSLRDAQKKMSKSDPTDNSRINLTDSADVIRDKIGKAKTDSDSGWTYDPVKRPDVSNLMNLFAVLRGVDVAEVERDFQTATRIKFKDALIELLVARVCPIGTNIQRLLEDRGHVDRVLKSGEAVALEVATKNLDAIKHLVGLG